MSDRSKSIAFCLFLLCLLIFVYVNTRNQSAMLKDDYLTKPIDFNPRECRDAQDQHIYLAIERTVFKAQFDADFRLHDVQRRQKNPKLKFPTAFDSNEKEGCFGNPIQVWSFFQAYVGTVRGIIDYKPQLHYERYFNDMLNGKYGENGKCEKVGADSRFTVCISRDPRSVLELQRIFKADKDHYHTPDGSNFIVYCDHLPFQNCSLNYDVGDSFSVWASFWLDVRPIEKTIQDDQRRRLIYNEMIVKNYPWKD